MKLETIISSNVESSISSLNGMNVDSPYPLNEKFLSTDGNCKKLPSTSPALVPLGMAEYIPKVVKLNVPLKWFREPKPSISRLF